ncbi:MAG TPA: helix-turn-helix domain-containing protein [Ruminiclostridium sp.]|nr:helix-turn-helix domain-containing protein [Ruminiclostridium sp.]
MGNNDKTGSRIIIIDDDDGIIKVLKSLLSKYYVEGFTNANTGIQKIKKEKFDLLILDYYLIDTNGEEVVSKIREFDKNIYIFLLTGFKDTVPPLKTLNELDIQFYCEKSADIENVIVNIESAVKSIEFVQNRMKASESFSSRLKELRKARNVSQEDLAKYVGVGRTAVANWETGIAEPNAESLRKIATFFNVSIDYLMCYEVDYSNRLTQRD